jgi:AAA-like domain
MSINETLQTIEQVLLLRPLNPIERYIFQQSWIGRNYHEMAQDCSYGTTYMKEVGSQLWQDLSKAVGTKVTKKNLHLVLRQYKRHLAENISVIHDPDASWPQIRASTMAQAASIDYPSGPIPSDSPFYIDRPPLESLAFTKIQQPGCALRIRAPHQFGKSSLLNRILTHAVDQGYEKVCVDFQEADNQILSSLDRLLRWFCINVSRQLGLPASLPSHWNDGLGSKVSCKLYFESYLLEQTYGPIVIALNEIDWVYKYPAVADDFLSMLRYWHEQARQNSTWRRVRFVLVQTSEVYGEVELKQSPFNVGLALSLPPFTLEQTQTLALRYGLNWTSEGGGQRELRLLYELLGGHPYLINLAFYHLQQGDSLDQILAMAAEPTGIYSQYLRERLAAVQNDLALQVAIQQLLQTQTVQLNPLVAYRLEGLSLVRLEGMGASLSCDLYRLYFQKNLPETLNPEAVAAVTSNLFSAPAHSVQPGFAEAVAVG